MDFFNKESQRFADSLKDDVRMFGELQQAGFSLEHVEQGLKVSQRHDTPAPPAGEEEGTGSDALDIEKELLRGQTESLHQRLTEKNVEIERLQRT